MLIKRVGEKGILVSPLFSLAPELSFLFRVSGKLTLFIKS